MPSPLDTIPQTTQDFALYKELLYQLIVTNKYQKVLETGTDVGDTTRIFSSALQATQGQLVTVDLKPPVNDWPKDWPIKNIQFVTGDSRQLKLQQEIDLLFLDAHGAGTNAYEHVKAELTNLGVWVKPGVLNPVELQATQGQWKIPPGRIVLDDVFHSEFGEGIRKATMEFCRIHLLTWTMYSQHNGLGIVEVSRPLPR